VSLSAATIGADEDARDLRDAAADGDNAALTLDAASDTIGGGDEGERRMFPPDSARARESAVERHERPRDGEQDGDGVGMKDDDQDGPVDSRVPRERVSTIWKREAGS